jgi:hypothetical protein
MLSPAPRVKSLLAASKIKFHSLYPLLSSRIVYKIREDSVEKIGKIDNIINICKLRLFNDIEL